MPLKIIKEPLKEKIPDIKPNFPRFENLHLELLENKKKLKPGLPLIPIKRAPQKPVQPRHEEPVQESPKSEPKKSPEAAGDEDIESDLIRELGVDEEDHITDEHSEAPEVKQDKDDSAKEEDVQSEPEEDDISPEEKEEQERQEYLIRFRILKKKYPTADFPTYTEHTDLHTLKRLYDETVRMIDLDTNVDNYKLGLMFAFFGIELAAKKLGLNFSGFTSYQMKKMDSYNRLLIELGEKSYANFAANWPVEVRLAGLIILNAGVFYLGKIISQHGGKEIAKFFEKALGFSGASSRPATPEDNSEPKRKMRGPSTRPEDIRKMAKED